MSTSLVGLVLSLSTGIVIGTTATTLFARPSGPPSPTNVPTSDPSRRSSSLLPIEPSPSSIIGPVVDYFQRLAYITAYDRKHRIPAWTAEHLTADNIRPPPPSPGSEGIIAAGDRSNSTFKEDQAIPAMFRAKLVDYFRSGYDRGHMVPAADAKSSQEAMDQTFLLSNVAPQVGDGFNRHYWAYLEAFCRKLTSQFDDVYVFTVPLFLPSKSAVDGKFRVTYEVLASQNNGQPTIAVPTHFAKVIIASRSPSSASSSPSRASHPSPKASAPASPSSALTSLAVYDSNQAAAAKEWSIGAFVLPNAVIPEQTRLETFLVPVESIESSAGLTLLPDQLKKIARPLCSTVSCQLVIRKFDDASKGKGSNGKAGGNGGGGARSNS